MFHITGHWPQLGWVAVKAALMYATALLGLRVGERRTLAQWTAIDFVTAVAMGALVGRTATASSTSYVFGLVAIATLLAAHRVASLVRFIPFGSWLTDHRVRILVSHGSLRRRELRWCGLTDEDLYTQLRERGYRSIEGVRYVIYEPKGSISVVPETATAPIDPDEDGPLVQAALDGATGYP